MRCEFLRHLWWGVRWHACFQGKALLHVDTSSSARMLLEIRIKSNLEYLSHLKGEWMNPLFWSSLESEKKKKTSRIFLFCFFAETSLLLYIINVYTFFALLFFIPFLFDGPVSSFHFMTPPEFSNFSKVIISSFRLWKFKVITQYKIMLKQPFNGASHHIT